MFGAKFKTQANQNTTTTHQAQFDEVRENFKKSIGKTRHCVKSNRGTIEEIL